LKVHEIYIKRCLQIAKNGLGTTQPNPMVGAVIVFNDQIIGEGYTSAYGGPHAEVNAIDSVTDQALLSKSTLYVTLEPCSHYGKTPPCSDLIIRHKIPKVVIGCVDDNPEVAGKGIVKLRASGCEVLVGVLENACKKHHKRFFTYHNNKRPYIILKWAQTTDGYIAPLIKDTKEPVWITNQYSRQLVHKWRAQEQAILVGTNTVVEDNPTLTVRDWFGKNPVRIILDQKSSIGLEYKCLNKEADTLVISGNETTSNKTDENQNGWTIYPPKDNGLNATFINIDWNKKHQVALQVCDVLYRSQINSVIIEGGAKTLQAFIDENLWDEARIFSGRQLFGEGIKAPKFNGFKTFETKILDDSLKIYIND
jgi:diaminohydroxyphosphoribosylaminopyrimidine deaminase/5-amino-6-(5-phosphoribosylamino)uracil reductase